MRIGIDARAYGWAGLGRYARNLLLHLTRLPGSDEYVVFAPRSDARELAELPRVCVVPVASSYYSLREQTTFLHALLRQHVDVQHFLHFNAPMLYRRPSVVTIHDLTRFFFPAQKHQSLFHQWMYEEVFRSVVLKAQRIITVSEHTKRDLIRFFPQTSRRVTVIPEGIDREQYIPRKQIHDADSLQGLGIQTPYLLFVGVWMNHKNLARLLAAFRLVKEYGFPGSLVITGVGRLHDEHVPEQARQFGVERDVVFPGVVPEHILPVLYRHAEAYIFPSLYEGFGFTPLEAMACGVPVVASDVACMPEVLGDAAEYIHPFSSEDIARGIWRVLQDRDYRTHLIDRGFKQVAHYEWATCAKKTQHVYHALRERQYSSPTVFSKEI